LRTLRAFLEQEATEKTEKGYELCVLCFLPFKLRMLWLRPAAAPS